MCGIAALLSAKSHDVLKLVQAMTGIVRHRGPDDEGAVIFAGPDDAPLVFGGADTPASSYESGLPYSPNRQHGNPTASAGVAMGHRRLSIVDVSALGHQPMCRDDGRYW